ncbi:protein DETOXIFICATION 16-like isoform X2 [Quercus robur]|uniref:protein DETOXIFICATION 16-like isoform X2 n=1 Tax=Quercus robur TaxID=38942 RepID=UPI002161D4A4|nr:protein DETOXIFICATION 16-like isoform X2 [Quercus robur]
MERGEYSGLGSNLITTNERSHEMEGEERSEKDWCRRANFVEETRKQLGLAGPLIAVSILQYSLQVISVMFNGHLGELPLSGASMGSSFASVTGYTVLLGMGSALETLCGQAYGAKQYHMLGVHTQRAMLTLLALSIPLATIWYHTSTILIALGQDHEISTEAGIFNRSMIPSLFAYGLLQCLNRFLQTQNNVIPMLISSGFTALLHVLVCWVLVFKIKLGIKGAALAISISNWVNVLLLAIYVRFSQAFLKTWTGFSKESLHDILSFIKLAVPSAIMICLNTCWMVYMISVGLGGAISTRVSNELGAGCPHGALLALRVMITLALLEGTTIGITTLLVRNVWGKLYSKEEEVIKYVAKMMPLLALSDFLDGFQCVLSGAARGCGWQNLCSFINLGAYYFVGIPSAVLFAFIFHFGGIGLWMGIICGLSVQVVVLVTVNLCTDWNQEAMKVVRGAREVA